MRVSLRIIIALFVTAFGLAAHTGYVNAQADFTQIKAVFLFKFTDYVTWPIENRPADGGNFSLCIWGDHPFGKTLEVIARKQDNYKYEIHYVPRTQVPKYCHLIFTNIESERLAKLNGVLIVSDLRNFARHGGMIEMAEQDGRIKLIGNVGVAEDHGFKISSRLLDIMDVIR